MTAATKVLDLETLPLWVLLTFAVVGVAALFGVTTWILPSRLRRRHSLVMLVVAALLFARVITTRDTRGALWFVGLMGVASLSLMVMGQMPADMPSAKNPAVRLHPLYQAIARRGRLAGLGYVALIVILSIVSLAYVRT